MGDLFKSIRVASIGFEKSWGNKCESKLLEENFRNIGTNLNFLEILNWTRIVHLTKLLLVTTCRPTQV